MTPPEILQISDVSVAFGGNVVLDGFSFATGPGFTGLIGPNGAGKTTCLNVISGYIHPERGDVRLRETSLVGRPPHKIAAGGVSRTFQTPRLVPSISALDNVLLGGNRRHRRGHLAELFGSRAARQDEAAVRERAAELLAGFGLGEVTARRASAFPIGSQKIIEVARALLNDPAVLLLDEPAAGLGAEDVETLVAGLAAYLEPRDTSVVIIEHDLDLITRLCPRVAVLHFGRVISEGRPEDILRDQLVVEAYLGAGFATDR